MLKLRMNIIFAFLVSLNPLVLSYIK